MQNNYGYSDNAPIAGNNYYRLKMVDRDGTFAFSQLRKVSWDGKALSVFPNPAADRLEMDVKDWSKVAKMSVMNASGNVIAERRSAEISGEKHMQLTSLKPGNYILKIEYLDGSSERTHFVKY
ncbi:T9SS type A sorting domain-containing protein [Dyadobacter sp. 676]|uniref:T9SS type A sorting domain-containing protein n=1 Tax=Dyadobacter sp. 676 TaxID=3088362 RepID=A0AAU8FSA4_9BACT